MLLSTIGGGREVQKRSEISARDLVIEAIHKFPDERDKQFEWFREQLEASPEYQRDVDWYYFGNMSTYLQRDRSVAPKAAAPSPAVVREAQRKFADAVKEQIKLLSLTMPNGKPMSACLGREMAEFGVRYKRIAHKVGAVRTVGEVLTEAQVRAFLK